MSVINLATNSSLETNANGWGGTVRDTTRAYVGTTSARSADGLHVVSISGLPANTTYTISSWSYIPANVTGVVTPRIGSSAVVPANGAPITVRDAWVRSSMTFTTDADSGTLAYYPALAGVGDRWSDAVMLTEGTAVVDYFDGDSINTFDSATGTGFVYEWTGVPHASASRRYTPVRVHDLTFVTGHDAPPNRRVFSERRETFLRLGRVRLDDGFSTSRRDDGTQFTTTYATLRARKFFYPEDPYRTSTVSPGFEGLRPLNFRLGRVGLRRPQTRVVITTSSPTHQFLNGRVRLVRASTTGSLTKFAVWAMDQKDPAVSTYVESATNLFSAGVTANPTRHNAVFVPHPDTRYVGIGARVFDLPNSGTYRTQYFKKWMLEKAPVGTSAPSAKYGKAREVQVFVKPDRINLAAGASKWTTSGTMLVESFSKVRVTSASGVSTVTLQLDEISARAGEQYWLVSDVYTDNSSVLLHAKWDGVDVNSDRVQLAPGRWTTVAIRINETQAKAARFTWVADVSGAGNSTAGGFAADTSDEGTYLTAGTVEDPNDPGTYIVSPALQDPNDPGTYLPGTPVTTPGNVSVFFQNVLVEKSDSGTAPAYFNGSTSADTLWEKGGTVGASRSYLYKNRQARYDAMTRVLAENVPMGIGVADPVFATFPVDW